MKKSTILIVLVVIVAGIAGAWVARATRSSETAPVELQYGTALTAPQPVPPFALLDQHAAAIDASALQGQWSLMFFGFTNCPAVCPTTLTLLTDVRKRMGAHAPRVVLVSVDPERDTPEVMANYVAKFDPTILGITGSTAAIDAFATAMGIAHSKVPMGNDQYMVDHTAVVFVIDPQGRRRAVFSPPLDAAQIASDFERLIGSPDRT